MNYSDYDIVDIEGDLAKIEEFKERIDDIRDGILFGRLLTGDDLRVFLDFDDRGGVTRIDIERLNELIFDRVVDVMRCQGLYLIKKRID